MSSITYEGSSSARGLQAQAKCLEPHVLKRAYHISTAGSGDHVTIGAASAEIKAELDILTAYLAKSGLKVKVVKAAESMPNRSDVHIALRRDICGDTGFAGSLLRMIVAFAEGKLDLEDGFTIPNAEKYIITLVECPNCGTALCPNCGGCHHCGYTK